MHKRDLSVDEWVGRWHKSKSDGHSDSEFFSAVIDRYGELLEVIEDMVYQHCGGMWPVPVGCKEERVGSNCLSANADAIQMLCDVGRFEQIEKRVGRAIEARKIP